jgi:hypothetical protein
MKKAMVPTKSTHAHTSKMLKNGGMKENAITRSLVIAQCSHQSGSWI